VFLIGNFECSKNEYLFIKNSKDRIYKSAECSEVLQLIDESPDANYCKALREVLEKYPQLDRAELEIELNQFI